MVATKTAPATFPTHIDLPEHDRQRLIELINERLADAADLYSQVKQARWNVKGPNFYELHLLFDQLAGKVFPYIDLPAEGVAALGGVVLGTVRMAGAGSSLPEYPVDATEGQKHLKALIDHYAVYLANIRKAIDVADKNHDLSTADVFTEISRTADKQLWSWKRTFSTDAMSWKTIESFDHRGDLCLTVAAQDRLRHRIECSDRSFRSRLRIVCNERSFLSQLGIDCSDRSLTVTARLRM
jgi:starvation-inducible DNA-binding protein